MRYPLKYSILLKTKKAPGSMRYAISSGDDKNAV